jgi:thiol-disulfide isomerase/thioredoxin
MRSIFLAVLLCVSTASLFAVEKKEKASADKKAPSEKKAPKADDPIPAKPEEIVAEMEKLLTDDSDDGAKSEKEAENLWKDRVARVDALIAAFRKQFPDNPLRWDVLYWEANSFDVREQLGMTQPLNARPVTEMYAEIANAPDAKPATKAKSSAERLMAMSGDLMEKKITLADWEKEVTAHLDKFPDCELNPMIQDQRLSFVEELAPTRLISLLEELSKNSNADIASMAKQRLTVAKERELLKSKPLELKFKSLEGEDVDLEKLRGKVVLIQFWATWCGPCMAEMPHVQEAYAKFHDKGFEILGISLDDDEKELRAVLKKKKIAWTQCFDGKGWESPLAKRFGIDAIPALWLVNKQGMVTDTDVTEGLAEKVAKLVGE